MTTPTYYLAKKRAREEFPHVQEQVRLQREARKAAMRVPGVNLEMESVGDIIAREWEWTRA